MKHRVIAAHPSSARPLREAKQRAEHVFPLQSELGSQMPLSAVYNRKGKTPGDHQICELEGALESIQCQPSSRSP